MMIATRINQDQTRNSPGKRKNPSQEFALKLSLDALHEQSLHARSERTNTKLSSRTTESDRVEFIYLVQWVVALMQIRSFALRRVRAEIILIRLSRIADVDTLAFDAARA